MGIDRAPSAGLGVGGTPAVGAVITINLVHQVMWATSRQEFEDDGSNLGVRYEFCLVRFPPTDPTPASVLQVSWRHLNPDEFA